ncbi:hypothetical protein BJV82DRAFT_106360 [Fennellomyces sp. T-0311]|nr:hypothetical protein BJV82DRAFT_106360 [Fennellomyces sp. T-0311]
MEPAFQHESNLSLRKKAAIGETSGNGAPANVSIDSLLLEARLRINHHVSSSSLTASRGVTRKLTSRSVHQQRTNEFQEFVEPQMTTVPMALDQTVLVGWTNDFVSTISSAEFVHPTLQLEQAWEPEQEGLITYEEILAAINPDTPTTSLGHSSNPAIPQNSRSFRCKQSAPYDSQTIQSRGRRLSQSNLGQNLMLSTRNHRSSKSTSDVKFFCRVEDCVATFTRARDEKRHFKTVHESCNYHCILCGSLFTRIDSLRRHLDKTCGRNNRGKK